MTERDAEPTNVESAMPEHVGNNIQLITTLFAKAESRVGRHQLAIERMTDAVGRPATTYALALVVLCWVGGNAIAPLFGARSIDPPPFVWLQGVACVLALQVAVIILTTQNRAAKLAQRHAHLDLQINLIAEEKIAKLVALVEELRRDLPFVTKRIDPLADAMAAAVNVNAVVVELEAIELGEEVT